MKKQIDIQKLMKALDECYGQPETCGVEHCYYWEQRHPYCECMEAMHKDAVELLKEKPALATKVDLEGGDRTYWYVCGECHTYLGNRSKYCPECGRKIIWE